MSRTAVRTARPVLLNVDEAQRLRDLLTAAGCSAATADGVIGWLITGSRRDSVTEARYNLALDEVGFSGHRIRRRNMAAARVRATGAYRGSWSFELLREAA